MRRLPARVLRADADTAPHPASRSTRRQGACSRGKRAMTDFIYSNVADQHRLRARAILRAHPDVRRYFGTNAVSLVIVLVLVTLQISLAAWVANLGWWAVFALAYAVGAFLNHGLLVMVHECAHHLVLRRRVPNILTGVLAGLPSILLNSVAWSAYHLGHHAHQGMYSRDYDMPSRWEARLVGYSAPAKALWVLLTPLVLLTRPLRGGWRLAALAGNGWVLLNLSAQCAFGLSIGILFGGKAVAYLVASLFFSIGLHPLGGRLIQEHFVTVRTQDTYSYYGSLNRVVFNVGYHNEHHDFPGVPWQRLPAVRRLAPEAYDTLVSYGSWTGLLLRFLARRDLDLFDRMVRTEPEAPLAAAYADVARARQASRSK